MPHDIRDIVNTNSSDGLYPVKQKAITWTNVDLRSMGPLGTNIEEAWIKIRKFSF